MIPIRDVNPTRVKPFVTLVLIAINLFVFLVVQPRDTSGQDFVVAQAAIPCEVATGSPLSPADINAGTCVNDADQPFFPGKSISFSVLASMFLHGDFLHIGFNLWSLWIFGNNIEEAFGRTRYLAMYLISGLAATLGYVALNPESIVPLVGASGAIAGVIGAYLVLFPRHQITAYVPPIFVIPLPATIFILFWFVGQFFIGSESAVAWQAHVVGFLVGFGITFLMRSPLRSRLNTIHGRPAGVR